MDRIAEWRPVEPAGPDGSAGSEPGEEAPVPDPQAPEPAANRRLIGAVVASVTVAVCAVAGALAFIVLAGAPKPAVAIDSSSAPAAASAPAGSGSHLTSEAAGDVVVDVEGAVNQSGLFRLPLGSRIGDAITAAGGYSAQVDIDGATAALNLAAVLADGQQVHVPLRGEVTSPPVVAAGSPGPSVGSSLIDINHATSEELDTLPGIGPVTAAKIIAARQETPFATVDDLTARAVVGASTLEKIRSLITVTP
jgi:competence protein ComEA